MRNKTDLANKVWQVLGDSLKPVILNAKQKFGEHADIHYELAPPAIEWLQREGITIGELDRSGFLVMKREGDKNRFLDVRSLMKAINLHKDSSIGKTLPRAH